MSTQFPRQLEIFATKTYVTKCLPWPPYLQLQAPPSAWQSLYPLYTLSARVLVTDVLDIYSLICVCAPPSVNSKSFVYLLYPQGLEQCLIYKRNSKLFWIKKLFSDCYRKNALPIETLICKIFWKSKVTVNLLSKFGISMTFTTLQVFLQMLLEFSAPKWNTNISPTFTNL